VSDCRQINLIYCIGKIKTLTLIVFVYFSVNLMIRRLSTNRISYSLRILGIETSCDDTAAAVVDSERIIISQACRNQLKYHQPWGGIVPSIAKNHHYENLVPVVAEVMKDIDWNVSH
jgi:N6-L-threonylcarbamoyladenine synthase